MIPVLQATAPASPTNPTAPMAHHFTLAPSTEGDKPREFVVALPEGNYNVTVTLGGPAASVTTVRAEARRLMLAQVATRPGERLTRTFTVNVHNARIAGTPSSVSLKARDREPTLNRDWDDKLTLEFTGVTSLRFNPSTSRPLTQQHAHRLPSGRLDRHRSDRRAVGGVGADAATLLRAGSRRGELCRVRRDPAKHRRLAAPGEGTKPAQTGRLGVRSVWSQRPERAWRGHRRVHFLRR